jgi:hypothetical protein
MSDPVIDKAKQKMAFHEAELKRLRDFIATYESLRNEPPNIGGTIVSKPPPQRILFAPSPATTVTVEGLGSVTKREQIIKAAAEILKNHSEPRTTSELIPEMESRGVRIEGTNPISYVSSVLSRWSGVSSVSEPRRGWVLTP